MDPSLDRFIRAQQTWDRAFACNIARALIESDPPLVVGIIGRGHLDMAMARLTSFATSASPLSGFCCRHRPACTTSQRTRELRTQSSVSTSRIRRHCPSDCSLLPRKRSPKARSGPIH
jgi:Haem-binding uptake, Tiki superfamily, ChaN